MKLTPAIGLNLVLLMFGCQDPSRPEDRIKNPSYTWRIDSIGVTDGVTPLMYSIWASDSANAYAVGFSSVSSKYSMYRYDGSVWRTTGFHIAEGGPISGPVTLRAVHGFSRTEVWVVGERSFLNPSPPPSIVDSSLVISFDGVTWEEHAVGAKRLLSIWGISSHDLWIGSANGELLHFDGQAWKSYPTPRKVGIVSIAGRASNEVYALGATSANYPPVVNYMFRWDGINWEVVDTTIQQTGVLSGFGGGGIENVGGEIVSFGFGLFRWTSPGWQLIANDGQNWIGAAFGSRPDEIFMGSNAGRLYRISPSQTTEIGPTLGPSTVYVAGHEINTMLFSICATGTQSIAAVGLPKQ